MTKSDSIKELATALSKVQASVKKAIRNCNNPFFKSKYADLESVWDACRDALTSNGFSVAQMLGQTPDGKPSLTTILAHSSGEFYQTEAPLPVAKGGAQDIGSAVTYFKRFQLSALVGIADQDDDDAESTTEKETNPASPRKMAREMKVKQQEIADNPGQYVPTFGKYKGMPLESIPAIDVSGYIAYIENKAQRDDKPLQGQVLEFIKNANKYCELHCERPAAFELDKKE